MTPTCACGRPATANGRECGFHFRQRLGSVQVNERGFEQPSTRRNHYDRDAVHDVFGEDARDRYLEETRGLGGIQYADDGSEWVYDDPDTGAMRPLEPQDVTHGLMRGERVE